MDEDTKVKLNEIEESILIYDDNIKAGVNEDIKQIIVQEAKKYKLELQEIESKFQKNAQIDSLLNKIDEILGNMELGKNIEETESKNELLDELDELDDEYNDEDIENNEKVIEEKEEIIEEVKDNEEEPSLYVIFEEENKSEKKANEENEIDNQEMDFEINLNNEEELLQEDSIDKFEDSSVESEEKSLSFQDDFAEEKFLQQEDIQENIADETNDLIKKPSEEYIKEAERVVEQRNMNLIKALNKCDKIIRLITAQIEETLSSDENSEEINKNEKEEYYK